MTFDPKPGSTTGHDSAREQSTRPPPGRNLGADHGDVLDVSPDKLRALTDAVPALISYFDADHICRFANEHHFRWYGREPDHLVGIHMRELLGDATYESRKPYLDRVAAGHMVSFDAQVPHRDGRRRDAAVRYVPRMGPDGFEGIYILVFDIAIQEHRFHSVFDGTAVGFWVVDFAPVVTLLSAAGAGDAEDRLDRIAADPMLVRRALDATPVRDINAKASELFGVSAEVALEQPFGRWCPNASLPAFAEAFLAYLSGRPSFETETEMTGQDGRAIDVLLSCSFAKNASEATTIVIGTTDITARIQCEKMLARAQAEIAYAARAATLGQLMASIAHEVNQPLTAVVTNGDAAMRWLDRAEPDTLETKKAIGRIVSEGYRAAEIMDRTRAIATKSESLRTAFDINVLIEETVASVRRQVAALGAEVSLELEPGLPKIVGNRIQLQQVAINLIMNGAQAMADHVTQRRQIIIRSIRDREKIAVEVGDTGPGLDPASVSSVFEAFYTTKQTGIGMGLAITKAIVESHGGTVSAVPAGDRGGASFTFTIPLPRDPTLDA